MDCIKSKATGLCQTHGDPFIEGHHQDGYPVCDWAAWMFSCDCHYPMKAAARTAPAPASEFRVNLSK